MRWLVVLLGICGIAIACSAVVLWYGAGGKVPWFGYWDASFSHNAPYSLTVIDPRPNGAAASAGLRKGDRIDLRTLSFPARVALVYQPFADRPNRLRVSRGTHSFETVVRASSAWQGAKEWKLPTGAANAATALAYALCALLLAIRAWSDPRARVLAFIFVMQPLVELNATYFVIPQPQVQLLLDAFSNVARFTAQLLFVRLCAMSGAPSRARTIANRAAVAVLGVQLSAALANDFGIATLLFDPLPLLQRVSTFRSCLDVVAAAGVLCVAVLAVRATPRPQRPRTGWLLLPLPVALAAFSLEFGASAFATSWFFNDGIIVASNIALLLGAGVVTYAVLSGRVVDAPFVIGRALVIASVSAIVVVAFSLLEFLLNTYLSNVSHATGLVANAGLALVLGLSITAIHRRVDDVIERLLFRKRREDERAILDFSKECAFITTREALLDRTIAIVARHTDARDAAIFLNVNRQFVPVSSTGTPKDIAVDENDPVILALKTRAQAVDPHGRTSAFEGALALPLLARGRLLGVLLLGERAGGEAYAPDETEALTALAHGVASALDVFEIGGRTDSDALSEAFRVALAPLYQRLDAIYGERPRYRIAAKLASPKGKP